MIDAESRLVSSSLRFTELESSCDFRTVQAYHEVGAAIRSLSAALSDAEASGIPRPRLRELVKEASEAHALSPFVNRLQTWPQGYPGDFLTVEHLMTQRNEAQEGTMGFMIEEYCLATRIAQQHRNKMHHQARLILRTVLGFQSRTKTPKVLVLAAGAAPDVRYVLEFMTSLNFRIVINDSDPEAIERALEHLASISDRVIALEGNALRCAEEILAYGPYDLVVAGGLFDYLNHNWATQFVTLIMNSWLAPGGEFFFTNIATGNPYRLWMECVTDWEVLERTPQDLVTLVTDASAVDTRLQVTREATKLTLLAHAFRK